MLSALAAFAIWIAYGIWRARSARSLRDRVFQVPRPKRIAAGILMLLLSVPFGLGPIAFAMVLSTANGGHPSVWGWIMVVGGGLLLIQFQILGVTALVASVIEDRVTETHAQTSLKESSLE